MHPNDSLRLTFLTQFRASVSFDHETRLWATKIGPYVALGSTLRRSVYEAMRWTKKQTND